MKNQRNLIISMVGILLLIVVACNFSASTANIKNAYTARDDNGQKLQTAAFTQDDVFYCIVEVANAPDDTVTKAVWYAVDAEGVEPNFFLAEAEITGGGELTFDLTNNELLWPTGKYKVELYLNEKLDRTLEFSVIGGVSTTAGPAAIVDAYTYRDNNGTEQPTNVFTQDDVFYCAAELENAAANTVVNTAWYAVDAQGVEPNFLIAETELTGGGLATFELSNDQLWPLGSYKVELYLNGEFQGALDFTVNQ